MQILCEGIPSHLPWRMGESSLFPHAQQVASVVSIARACTQMC